MAQILKNNVSGVLSTQLNPADISMVLVDASNFPAPLGGDFYLLTLVGLNINGQEATWEVVKVTAKASNTLTVVRAQESTAAATWPAGATVQLRLTAGTVATQDALVSGLATKEPTIAVGTTAQYRRGDKTWQTLDKAAAGLANVDNTADAAKPVSTATQTALDAKQNSLGFTPIQQGGGTGQAVNKIYVGWAADSSGLMAQVDNTNYGNDWPINISKNAATVTKLATARTINGVSFDGSANISIDAAAVPNTPAGSIVATTVQAALNELASEKVATTAVIAIANGGTGATSANAAADAIGAFRRGTLLGTVSQSAGVPTGAVVEFGSNAAGDYVRWADGTQIMRAPRLVVGDTAAFQPIAIAAAYTGLAYVSVSFDYSPQVGTDADWFALSKEMSIHSRYTPELGIALLYRGPALSVNGYAWVSILSRWY